MCYNKIIIRTCKSIANLIVEYYVCKSGACEPQRDTETCWDTAIFAFYFCGIIKLALQLCRTFDCKMSPLHVSLKNCVYCFSILMAVIAYSILLELKEKKSKCKQQLKLFYLVC